MSFSVLVSSGYMLRGGIAWSYGGFIPSFYGITIHLPQWLYQFTFPPTGQECSLFSTPSPASIVCRLFEDGHSDRCEVISHCGFDWHFSNNERCWVRAGFFKRTLDCYFLEKEWHPTPAFMPGKPHRQRSLVGYSLWGHKSWTQWLSMQAVINGRLLYKGMYIFLFSSYIFFPLSLPFYRLPSLSPSGKDRFYRSQFPREVIRATAVPETRNSLG